MGMSFRALLSVVSESVWSGRLVWPNGAIAIYGIVCAPPQTHARGIWGMVFMPQAKKIKKLERSQAMARAMVFLLYPRANRCKSLKNIRKILTSAPL